VDREPPPVTVTAPGSQAAVPDLLDGAPERSGRVRPAVVLAVAAAVLLGVAVVSGRGPSALPPEPRATTVPGPGSPGAVPGGITATASLAGAATDEPFAQRLTLVVDLPPLDAAAGSDGRVLGDEAALLGVRLRGFAVRLDDEREVLPLGRFGVASRGRSTTLPGTAVVVDCSIEPQARRDIVLFVRSGTGPPGTVRVVAESEVVRALDRLVGRTCRRPRG
jgi:hypothetical protein